MADISLSPMEVATPVNASTGTAVSTSDAQSALTSSGYFKSKSTYLWVGDEPDQAPGVFDLKSALPAADVKSLKQYLTLMPRQMLWDFFMQKIWPGIPWTIYLDATQAPPSNAPRFTSPIYGGDPRFKKDFEDLVWASLIDLFNEANLEYITANKLTPWDWESQKVDAYTVSSSQSALDQLQNDLNTYQNVSMALDPKAKDIMDQYLQLPKLGDLGLEINRQNAVKELLKQKDYLSAQAIVDAYRYASDTVLGDTLAKPVPFDIVSADTGTVIKTTPGG